MRGRIRLAGAIGAVLVVATAAPGPAKKPLVPKNPHIVDVASDANFAYFVDQPTPASRAATDILAAWFTADKTYLTAYWHMGSNPFADPGIVIATYSIPNPEADDYMGDDNRMRRPSCVLTTVIVPLPDFGDPFAVAQDFCNESDEEALLGLWGHEELGDGSVILSAKFLRSELPAFERGNVLTKPYALSGEHVPIPTMGYTGIRIDATPIGRDFRVP